MFEDDKMEEGKIKWPNGASKEDWSEAAEGDGLKVYPNPARENSGGTVKKGMASALNTYRGCGSAAVVRGSEPIPVMTPGMSKRCHGRTAKEPGEPAYTVTTVPDGVIQRESGRLRIRYLTERECMRLMGQSEDAIDRMFAAEPSKTARYRAAGNSIVVDVLEAIFRGIYIDRTFEPGSRGSTLDMWGASE